MSKEKSREVTQYVIFIKPISRFSFLYNWKLSSINTCSKVTKMVKDRLEGDGYQTLVAENKSKDKNNLPWSFYFKPKFLKKCD